MPKTVPLFTESYRELIQRALKLNQDRRISGDIYFHPRKTGNKIIIKDIYLGPDPVKPLCEVTSTKKGGENLEEHWLEAYVINRSRGNDWQFHTSNKTYRFLSSQLKFCKSDSLRTGKPLEYHLVTDILLYDSLKGHLVIWELKSNASATSVKTAKDELGVYCKELTRLFISDETESRNARLAYGLENNKIIKVDGYIVLPESNNRYESGQFGIYEYSCSCVASGRLVKPWENYDKSVDLNFKLRGEPQ